MMVASTRSNHPSRFSTRPLPEKKVGSAHFFQEVSTAMTLLQGRSAQTGPARRDSGPSTQRAREISNGVEELPARNALVRPVAAVSDLDQALLGQEVPHGDANRHPEEVRVLELHAGALVAIVQQHVEARRHT